MTNYRPFRILLYLAIAGITLFGACVKEAVDDIDTLSNVKGIQTDLGFTLPLLDIQFGLKDVYSNSANSLLREEPDHSYTFVYNSSDTLPPQQFVGFAPVTVVKDLNIDDPTATVFNNVGQFSRAFSNYTVLPGMEDKKLKQLFIKKGSFQFHLTSDMLHNTNITLTFPSITSKEGVMLKLPMVLQFDAVNPVPADTTITVPIDEHTIDLTDGGISYNVLPYMLEFNIAKNTGSPPMAAGQKISINLTFDLQSYRGINGYVGRFVLDSADGENPIDLFSNSTVDIANVKLKDPRIKFSVASGFGIPITLKIKKISLVNTDNSELPIAINFLADTFTLPAPSLIGTYAYGSFVIDRNNSNIDDIINNLASNPPKLLKYSYAAYANYLGNEVDNFMFDTSSLITTVGMEIPLDIKIGKFAYNVYQPFTFPSQNELDLKSVGVSTVSSNTLPLDLRMQIYFGKENDSLQYKADSNTKIIDSLFDNGFILSKAIVDTNGVVVESNPVRSDGYLTREKYLRLIADSVNKMKITLTFETSRDRNNTQQYVKIHNTQGFAMKMGFQIKGRYRTK